MDNAILRIDAKQGASAITLFAATADYAAGIKERLKYGWTVETTPVHCGHLHPLERAGLIGPIWPQLPLAELVALADATDDAVVYEPARVK